MKIALMLTPPNKYKEIARDTKDTTDTFRLDNFIADPYTITFWMLSKYTGASRSEGWTTILTHGRFLAHIFGR